MAKSKNKYTGKYNIKSKRKFVTGGPESSPYITQDVYQAELGPTQKMQTAEEQRLAAMNAQIYGRQLSSQLDQLESIGNTIDLYTEQERLRKEKEQEQVKKEAATVGTGLLEETGKAFFKNLAAKKAAKAAAKIGFVPKTGTELNLPANNYITSWNGDAGPVLSASTSNPVMPEMYTEGATAVTTSNLPTTATGSAGTAMQAGSNFAAYAPGIAAGGLTLAGIGAQYLFDKGDNNDIKAAKRSGYYDTTHYSNKEYAGQVLGSTLKGAGMGITVGGALGAGIGAVPAGLIGAGAGALYGVGKAMHEKRQTKTEDDRGIQIGNKRFGKKLLFGDENVYSASKDPYEIAKKEYEDNLMAQQRIANAQNNAFLTSRKTETNTGFPIKSTVDSSQTLNAKYGGKIEYLKGGIAKSLGRGAIEYVGKKHEQGGIDLPGNIEVEGGETEQNNYIFSATLKLPTGITYAQAHKNLLASGASPEEIKQLALSQEAVAGRNPNEIKTMKFAKYGGPLEYVDGGKKEPENTESNSKIKLYQDSEGNYIFKDENGTVLGKSKDREEARSQKNDYLRNIYLQKAATNNTTNSNVSNKPSVSKIPSFDLDRALAQVSYNEKNYFSTDADITRKNWRDQGIATDKLSRYNTLEKTKEHWNRILKDNPYKAKVWKSYSDMPAPLKDIAVDHIFNSTSSEKFDPRIFTLAAAGVDEGYPGDPDHAALNNREYREWLKENLDTLWDANKDKIKQQYNDDPQAFTGIVSDARAQFYGYIRSKGAEYENTQPGPGIQYNAWKGRTYATQNSINNTYFGINDGSPEFLEKNGFEIMAARGNKENIGKYGKGDFIENKAGDYNYIVYDPETNTYKYEVYPDWEGPGTIFNKYSDVENHSKNLKKDIEGSPEFLEKNGFEKAPTGNYFTVNNKGEFILYNPETKKYTYQFEKDGKTESVEFDKYSDLANFYPKKIKKDTKNTDKSVDNQTNQTNQNNNQNQTNTPLVTQTGPSVQYITSKDLETSPNTPQEGDSKPRYFMGAYSIRDENGNVKIIKDKPLMGHGAMAGSRLGTPSAEGLDDVRNNPYAQAATIKKDANYTTKNTGSKLSYSKAVSGKEDIAKTEWGKRWGYRPGMTDAEAKAAHDAFATEMRTKFDQAPDEMLGYYQYIIDAGAKIDDKGNRTYSGEDAYGDDARAIFENLKSKGYIGSDGKIKKEALSYLKTQATNEFVGPIHNAAGAYSLKEKPEPVKIIEEKKDNPPPKEKEKTPPPYLPPYKEYKDPRISLIQAVPAAIALGTNLDAANYSPSLASYGIGATAIGQKNLPRIQLNAERAANAANTAAINESLSQMSGPGSIAGMLAAKTKAQETSAKIAEQEANINKGLIAQEATMQQQGSMFNANQADEAEIRRMQTNMYNASQQNESNKFNTVAKRQAAEYGLETKLGAGEKVANALIAEEMANRQLRSVERVAAAGDYAGAYQRQLIKENLIKATKDKNSELYGKNLNEIYPLVPEYYKQMYGQSDGVVVNQNDNSNKAKFGGPKRYVSRLGELINKKNKRF
jgi:hypothetical protein